MAIDRGLLDRLRERGEEVFSQLSSELMANPRFMKAVEGAMRGREKLEEAAADALKQMNVPTRAELKRALGRIDSLEQEVQGLREQLKRARRPASAAPRKAAARPAPSRPRARKPRPGGGSTGSAE
jgi:polyhydroxyalkanoate synthesis regulator phasin